MMKAKDSPAATAVWLGLPTLTLAVIALAVWLPRRTLPDRLAGTYLVPR